MMLPKLKITSIKSTDFEVMHEAVHSYMHAIATNLEVEKKSSQHIHLSILNEFKFEITKRINTRTATKRSQLTIELHTAFVLFDALCFYSNQCDDHLNSARLTRIMMCVHAELPRTSDQKKLSIASSLNFNDNA